ncbi:MAG: glycoside hydrolase family 16 protein [Balneolales bacterium]
MRYFIYLLFFPALMLLSCDNQQETMQLVWSDEFDYEGLPDPDKWAYDVGYIANNEKQYYTESRLENARVEDGNLIIEARKEPWNDFDYTSARLVTRDRATWTYGRFEIRAKVPSGLGTWPAIWMLGENISEVGWPASGEIDIMEHVGFDPLVIHGNVHTEAYNHAIGTNKGGSIEPGPPWEEFKVYAIEWFEDRIDFYVNDEKYFSFDKESNDVAKWPFDKPHYLLLNLAIGGDWGGSEGIDNELFPHEYHVDYVRVYKGI